MEEIENIYNFFGLNKEDLNLATKIENSLKDYFKELDKIKEFNQLKVLKAMQESNLSDMHFHSTSGYGYNDVGREKIEEIYSRVFNTEDALVRTSIVNGTHALSICLNAILMPNDTMLSISGTPYDTLRPVIGLNDEELSLKEYGVKYKEVPLIQNGEFDKETIKNEILNDKSIKMAYIQRSKGYSTRKSLTIDDIKDICHFIKDLNENIIIMVDNCYGEFLDYLEPTDVGADIMAGSLIKNPGGGLALSGGYIVGKEKLVTRCSKKLTTNSIGKECGLTFNQNRTNLQGLFIAPSVVNGAVKGAVFLAKLFSEYGFDVFPKALDKRSDIIEAVKLNNEEEIVAFCNAIQKAAPVDSFVDPIPWAMPGYSDKVVMAAGAFVEGSSIELSADAPIREPYAVYFQGGLTYEHSKIGGLMAYKAVMKVRNNNK